MSRLPSLVVPFMIVCGCAKPPPAKPETARIECKVAAEHGVGVQSTSAELVEQTRTTVAASCERNQWSEESKRCLVGATTDDDRGKCSELLTDQQGQALKADLEAAFAGKQGVTVQATSADSPPAEPAQPTPK